MMKLSKKKKKLLAAVFGMALSCAAGGMADAAVNYNPEPPGSVMAETGEASYIVKELVITGNKRHSEEEIKRLVPEATRPLVRTGKLSRQLSLLNDGQTMRIDSAFTPIGNDEYRLTLVVEEIKNDRFAITANNTGNKFSGDWRLGLSWMNTDITKHGDSLGLSYTTSPDEHISDVKQIGFSYRAILPNAGDSMYFTYSYSDVDMGEIHTVPGVMNIEATGKGHTASFHYQRNMVYSRARRQMLDFGIDYKRYENGQNYFFRLIGPTGLNIDNGTDYDVCTFSTTYVDVTRGEHDAFSWNVGWTANLMGDQDDYDRIRWDSDKNFHIFRFGAGYQYTTKSDWIFGLSAGAQWTPNNLIQSEQFGAGGLGSVRGFKERVATGDNGFGGSFEICTPKYIPDSRFVLFVDGAWLSNNTINAGEVGNRHLSSWGIAYRYGSEKLGLYASIDYAHPMSYGGMDNGDAIRPWTFTLTKTF